MKVIKNGIIGFGLVMKIVRSAHGECATPRWRIGGLDQHPEVDEYAENSSALISDESLNGS